MPFFIRKKERSGLQSKKLKRGGEKVAPERAKKAKVALDEEIASGSESDLDDAGSDVGLGAQGEEEVEETAQEKRLRLAKTYLQHIKAEEAQRRAEEDEHATRDAVAHRIRDDILEQSGRLQKNIAQYYLPTSRDDIHVLRGHKLSVTCLVTSSDDVHVFTGAKDGSIAKWNVESMARVKLLAGTRQGSESDTTGHSSHVLSLALSTDNKYLVSGDSGSHIYVWNAASMQRLGQLSGHTKAVSGLAFRKGSHQLFSASHDKLVKIWNVAEMAFVENLYGHQDAITGVDSLTRERAITCGGRDRSVRIWKVIEESQLVFHAPVGSIDCVALINEEHFVTGADDNSISLWGLQKKKPLTTVKPAHVGTVAEGDQSSQKADQSSENWITCVTSLQHTDVIASAGSRDGSIRLWRCGPEFKSLHPLQTIPVTGFVNALRFGAEGLRLVAAVGQEHRLGRWWRDKAARNSVVVITMQRRGDGKNSYHSNQRNKSHNTAVAKRTIEET